MTDSAVFVGGAQQLLAAIVAALIIVVCTPAEFGHGWTRWRMAGFYLLWQVFTPLRPWYIDMPLLLISIALMELAWRVAKGELRDGSERK